MPKITVLCPFASHIFHKQSRKKSISKKLWTKHQKEKVIFGVFIQLYHLFDFAFFSCHCVNDWNNDKECPCKEINPQNAVWLIYFFLILCVCCGMLRMPNVN